MSGFKSASSFKDHILSIYPESDYASFLKDPDFYLKRQSNQDIAIKSYLDLLKQYRQKKYKNTFNGKSLRIYKEI